MSEEDGNLKDDIDHLIRLVWSHQEEKRKGFISETEICDILGWTQEKLEKILDILEDETQIPINKPKSGYLAYTW